jgi:NarL family two-component system response regulator LiaR
MYNHSMSEHSQFYRSPFLLTAAFLAIGVTAVATLFSVNTLTIRVLALALFLGIGLIVAVFRSGTNPYHVHLYLAVQLILVITLIILLPETDYPLILINMLCVQGAVLLPPRTLAGWIVIFIIAAGFGLVRLHGSTGFVTLIGQSSGLFAFAVVGGALRQAEITRRQSQVLLADLNQAHSQLKDYAAQAQKLAVAEERNRMARDLHDSAKQQAFAVAAQLGAARALLHRDPQAAEARLLQAEQLSDTLRQELAAMILELRPPALQDKGLIAALQDYAADWSRQYGITAEVVGPGEYSTRPEVEQAFFRIVQEALANIARHSRASHVAIELADDVDTMFLKITDNGIGFNPQAVQGGVGLNSGIRAFLEAQPGFTIVAEADSGEAAVRLAAEHVPDVVLMDLGMPGMDGVEATRRVKSVSPRTQIVVLTSYHEDEHIFPALRAGAISYLLKTIKMDDLAEAIHRAAHGEATLHPRVASRVIEELQGNKPKTSNPFADLTEREIEILKLIANGLSNAQIAAQLFISENTVKGYVSNILSKLHLADRTQAAVYAWREGVVKK